MIHSGLVSITFRQLSPKEIIDLVVQAQLDGIEWGGDIHVPHGDLEKARQVGQMTRQAGLKVVAYGSYYFVGHEKEDSFEKVLDTALELGADSIRIWAGKKDAKDADDEYFDMVVQQSRQIAEKAGQAGVALAYEFHGGSLASSGSATKRLIETLGCDNVKTYWQPTVGAAMDYCLAELDEMLDLMTNVHVFHWDGSFHRRLLLEQGSDIWQRYLQKANSLSRDCFAMIEYVKDDEPNNFVQDAATLKKWLAKITL